MDDIVKEWDALRESLPDDHAEAAEILFDRCDLMADRIEALEADVATALEALRFYANPDHWEPPYANPGENPFSVLDEDEGEVACVAIAQITGIPR